MWLLNAESLTNIFMYKCLHKILYRIKMLFLIDIFKALIILIRILCLILRSDGSYKVLKFIRKAELEINKSLEPSNVHTREI